MNNTLLNLLRESQQAVASDLSRSEDPAFAATVEELHVAGLSRLFYMLVTGYDTLPLPDTQNNLEWLNLPLAERLADVKEFLDEEQQDFNHKGAAYAHRRRFQILRGGVQ